MRRVMILLSGGLQVEWLVSRASQASMELRAGQPGAKGITPLHLAALYQEGNEPSGNMVALLAGVIFTHLLPA